MINLKGILNCGGDYIGRNNFISPVFPTVFLFGGFKVKYKVGVKEVHIQTYISDCQFLVEANSSQEAKDKISGVSGFSGYSGIYGEEYLIETDFVYSHTLDPDEWYVKEIIDDPNSSLDSDQTL